VKQALAANELLMKHLRNGAAPLTTDCLQEAPMELCAEQHVEVKLETEDEDCGDNDVSMTCSELPEPDEMDVESKKSVDPLTMIETVKLEAEPRSVQKPLEDDLASDFEDDEWVTLGTLLTALT